MRNGLSVCRIRRFDCGLDPRSAGLAICQRRRRSVPLSAHWPVVGALLASADSGCAAGPPRTEDEMVCPFIGDLPPTSLNGSATRQKVCPSVEIRRFRRGFGYPARGHARGLSHCRRSEGARESPNGGRYPRRWPDHFVIPHAACPPTKGLSFCRNPTHSMV